MIAFLTLFFFFFFLVIIIYVRYRFSLALFSTSPSLPLSVNFAKATRKCVYYSIFSTSKYISKMNEWMNMQMRTSRYLSECVWVSKGKKWGKKVIFVTFSLCSKLIIHM